MNSVLKEDLEILHRILLEIGEELMGVSTHKNMAQPWYKRIGKGVDKGIDIIWKHLKKEKSKHQIL